MPLDPAVYLFSDLSLPPDYNPAVYLLLSLACLLTTMLLSIHCWRWPASWLHLCRMCSSYFPSALSTSGHLRLCLQSIIKAGASVICLLLIGLFTQLIRGLLSHLQDQSCKGWPFMTLASNHVYDTLWIEQEGEEGISTFFIGSPLNRAGGRMKEGQESLLWLIYFSVKISA